MPNNNQLVVCIGEVLWDCFPDKKVLGGAPLNCAYVLQSIGTKSVMVSRIGSDPEGREIISIMKQKKMDTSYIQQDKTHPTGRVDIKISKTGQPDYTIVENVAWDYITVDNKLDLLVKQADAICYGTLAQRSKQSYETIMHLLKKSPAAIKVFDINLRQKFYTKEIIQAGIEQAHVLKLNIDELNVLQEMFKEEFSHGIQAFIEWFNIDMLAVTKGSKGCTLFKDGEVVDIPGMKVKVVDTVGSGDAFTASLINSYLQGASLDDTGTRANQLGSYIATQRGATPHIPVSYK
jgi:fructokinase